MNILIINHVPIHVNLFFSEDIQTAIFFWDNPPRLVSRDAINRGFQPPRASLP